MNVILAMFGKLLPVFILLVLVLVILITGYVKASPDTAYIISGLRKKPKVLIGRSESVV